jgi:hypothetical protein
MGAMGAANCFHEPKKGKTWFRPAMSNSIFLFATLSGGYSYLILNNVNIVENSQKNPIIILSQLLSVSSFFLKEKCELKKNLTLVSKYLILNFELFGNRDIRHI